MRGRGLYEPVIALVLQQVGTREIAARLACSVPAVTKIKRLARKRGVVLPPDPGYLGGGWPPGTSVKTYCAEDAEGNDAWRALDDYPAGGSPSR